MQQIFLAIILSFLLCIALGPALLPALKRLKFGQQVRDDGPQTHLAKAGTPTMGGILMAIALVIASLVFTDWKGDFKPMLMLLLCALGFGAIGFWDDFTKIAKKRSLGLKAREKMFWQFLLAIMLTCYCMFTQQVGTSLVVPFGRGLSITLSPWMFAPFAIFVILGTVNSANLIDGLDGLCAGVTAIMASALTLIALFATQSDSVDPTIARTVAIFGGATVGACLGFLRFNVYPARLFMGDTGAFVLGGAVAGMVMLLRLELLLPLLATMYILTSLSLIIQVVSYKTRKKRVFRMSPLHHHFELGGVPETRIVAMYMIITAVLCLLAIASVTK